MAFGQAHPQILLAPLGRGGRQQTRADRPAVQQHRAAAAVPAAAPEARADRPEVVAGARVEVDEAGREVRVVRLNRPERLNALSIDLAVELDALLAEVGRDNACRVVVLTGAGMSAALAGSIAAHTTLPVIGVPLASGALAGVDALLSTVQMPPGMPVATMAIGKPGAKNAGLLAVQILSLLNSDLAAQFEAYKQAMAAAVERTSCSSVAPTVQKRPTRSAACVASISRAAAALSRRECAWG